MRDYLAEFHAKTRRKADAELIRRWEWDARFNGDKNIKNELANAKRTATSLEKASKQFSKLRPEHELAIKAAASALRALVAELTPLAAWAKEYKTFCDAEFKKERLAELDAIAQKRWGGKESALHFELELMRELGTGEGRMAFGRWMHSLGKHTDAKAEDITCAVGGLAYGETNGTDGHRAALTLKEGMNQRFQKWTGMHGVNVVCPLADYEAYLGYRLEVAKTTARVVQMAREQ